MILIIHKEGGLVKNIVADCETLSDYALHPITEVFWELAEKHPDQLIAWCEEQVVININIENAWSEVFQNNHTMASFGINTCFFSEAIGYIDQLPFVNINRKIQYPTWQMSSDIGGVNGAALLKFKALLKDVKDFNYLLNSIAKIGQQNGLLCYSAPSLVKCPTLVSPIPIASTSQLFSFVFQHYNTIWTSVLFWCLVKYENNLTIIPYLKAFFYKKKFKRTIDLDEISGNGKKSKIEEFSIDVIIPTLGRKEYLKQVLIDLKSQTLLPKKVIIIEQNPDSKSKPELNEIINQDYPFKITHHFIHQVGACNARNLAIKEVNSNWVFFADDDIRMKSDILQKASMEILKYGFSAINFNCKQINEITVFPKIKQWGSFGGGTSIVKSDYAKKCEFSLVYENGYGEDADYGMQLRNIGCDIIYHPNIEILHLKAPIGGFREKPELPWDRDAPLPKPSPTLMTYVHSYYNPSQILGFKTSLFLKFYPRQSIKNPFLYLKEMQFRWKKSEFWANKLQK